MNPISRSELKHMLDSAQEITLVEVLGPEEYKKFHLPGAVNVPLDENFDEGIQRAVPDKNRAVVVYCLNPETDLSSKAALRMEELGYRRVYDYEPGKMDWKFAGLPVEPG